jgi:hypothetical protein
LMAMTSLWSTVAGRCRLSEADSLVASFVRGTVIELNRREGPTVTALARADRRL